MTATCADVSYGLSDLGAGDFWITAQRASLTHFTVPIFIETLWLWVAEKVHEEKHTASFRDMVFSLFRPLDPTVWALIGAPNAPSNVLSDAHNLCRRCGYWSRHSQIVVHS